LRTAGVGELVRLVKAGLPFDRLVKFQKTAGIPMDVVARLAGIPRRTLARRQHDGRLRPDESDRVLRLSTLFDLATDLFEGDADGARRWLESPQTGLGGEVPFEFASTEVGAREVENLILRLEHGVIA
jgi:putative toxin-antitoxin system antitoxin component (TIGR02293 family)